ncbi:MAG TPA: DegT/DnrJ/EryC1/StrS family aminotransferase [Candidatus Binatia bacterium]|jgi:dTDP-4-amino-4,6-dideoxygalactose transaminase
MTDRAPNAIHLVDLTRQYAAIKGEIDAAIQQTLNRGAFASNQSVAAFEEEFARYCGVKHCVCVNSGTSALHLAMIASGVHAGDEVITVPFTFVATAWAISYVGARPIFVDIEPRACNLDAEKLARAIGPKTRAVVPVHLYGQMADLDPIRELCEKNGLVLIEDTAQAHGGEYNGQRAGGYGHIGCFSFYPTKNLGAYGESGAITTNDEKIAERIRHLRDHAQTSKYRHEELGFNYRMDEMQGAILRVKLRYLEDWNAARSKIARYYINKLAATPVVLPSELPHRRHVWHLFVVRSPDRDKLRQELSKASIDTGLHYPIPLHLQRAYRHLGYRQGDFPIAEQVARECLSLPIYPELEESEINRVCDVVASSA